MSARHKVILLCWEGADWKIIHPMIDAGQMPNLSRMVENGVVGSLTALSPLVSPLLWTSALTGKTADRHGILGFLEPDPVTGGARPAAGTSRRVRAVWNVLNQNGLSAHLFGIPATHPAEPLSGLCVSDAFGKAFTPHGTPWPLPEGAIHPKALRSVLADLRVHPGDLRGEDLLSFVPELVRIDQKKDRRLIALASGLAESISVHAAATWGLERRNGDFLAAYYGAIGSTSRVFMPYHPPKMEAVSEEDFLLYRHVVTGIYQFHDMMLGRVLELAGPDAAVMIISAHGFHCGHMRPAWGLENRSTDPEDLLKFPSTMDELSYRRQGIICMSGPGIKKDEIIYGASLLDVAPTILTLCGLPAGEDMPGRFLAEAFENPAAPERIASWESVSGDTGMHATETVEEMAEAAAAMDELTKMGYGDVLPVSIQKQAESARAVEDFNLARVYAATGKEDQALALLEDLARRYPKDMSCRVYLAYCLLAANRIVRCREVVEEILQVVADRPLADFLRGMLALAEGMPEGLSQLSAAEKNPQSKTQLECAIGRVYLRAKLFTDAERVFRHVLEADPDLAAAHTGFAATLLATARPEAAADAALDAIGIEFYLPDAHYILGVALAQKGETTRAIQAFDICIKLDPANADAHHWLAILHRKMTGNKDLAEFHRRKACKLMSEKRSSCP